MKNENPFQWYDSYWLNCYTRTQQIIQENYPHKLKDFIASFLPLKTRPDFDTIHLPKALSKQMLERFNNLISELSKEEVEMHELLVFGRLIVHNLPCFNMLQRYLTPLACELAQEELIPSYNFLSLYNNFGICEMHLDAPSAKWTLDVCIDQSGPWPIHFSPVLDWPDDSLYQKSNWAQSVKENEDIYFSEYLLQPGEALFFSGSSQWHYRNRMPQLKDYNYCHLVFFHFIPSSMKDLIDPRSWMNYFDIPELCELEVYPNLDIANTQDGKIKLT